MAVIKFATRPLFSGCRESNAGSKSLTVAKSSRLYHVVDHPLQPHGGAIFGRVDFGHAIIFQLGDFLGDDDTAAAAKYLDVRRHPAL